MYVKFFIFSFSQIDEVNEKGDIIDDDDDDDAPIIQVVGEHEKTANLFDEAVTENAVVKQDGRKEIVQF